MGMIWIQRNFILASIALLTISFTSCRSAKYLEEHQALITDIDVVGIPPELKESTSLYIANDIRPNSPLYLTIYNLFNTRGGRYKTENIKNVGEAPRLLDSGLVHLSATQIERYLKTQGYFDASVWPKVDIRRKKAKIDFVASTGQQYIVEQVARSFPDNDVKTVFERYVAPVTPLRENKPYRAEHLYDERERLYVGMRDEGYFDYLRQYMRVGIDTLDRKHSAKLDIYVSNPDSGKHRIYRVDSVYVKILPPESRMDPLPDIRTDTAQQILFQDYTGNYRLGPIARYVMLRPGNRYSLRDENLSYDRLYEMNGFRSVKISYEKIDTSNLKVHYELTPRPAMSNQLEGEFIFNAGMNGLNLANTYSHRNIFGGSELLEIRLRYGVLFDPRINGSLRDKLFNNDFQIGANVVFPRLLTPFRVRSVGRYGLPRTTFSSSLQLFNQDNTYANKYLINSINYSWFQRENIIHSYTPIIVEYRDGRLNQRFMNNLIEQGYLLYVRSNNRQYFGLGSQYSLTYNLNKLPAKENFHFFRGAVDVSGNLLSLLSNTFDLQTNDEGERLIFGAPYLQYIKGEVDYRRYRHFGGNRQLVWRFNGGVAVPYGNNSSLLIFEKSFFAGGMNGIRAWQARTLGPGNYSRANLSEDLRLNLRNLDQLGEIKIESNIEYRFRMLNNFFGAKLNGAGFLDAGNVWRLRDDPLTPEGQFKANRILSQIAIGTGFGLRLDMDYFVIRLDAGLKVKDPQFSGGDQWVIRKLFSNPRSFRQSYAELHRPDRYSFVQYNFGVGMPF